MVADMQAVLEAGPAGEFFTRVMAEPDKAPPQLANADKLIERAAQSDNPNLQQYAESMRQALSARAEAEAIELSMVRDAANDPMGLNSLVENIQNVMEAMKTALADGFQMSDLGAIFNAFSGADPEAQQLTAHRRAMFEAMDNGEGYLEAARLDGVDIKEKLGTDNPDATMSTALGKIGSIAPNPDPSPPPSGSGPSGP